MDTEEVLAALRAKLTPEPESEELITLRAKVAMLEHANGLLTHALKAKGFENSAVIAANAVLRDELRAESAKGTNTGLGHSSPEEPCTASHEVSKDTQAPALPRSDK